MLSECVAARPSPSPGKALIPAAVGAQAHLSEAPLHAGSSAVPVLTSSCSQPPGPCAELGGIPEREPAHGTHVLCLVLGACVELSVIHTVPDVLFDFGCFCKPPGLSERPSPLPPSVLAEDRQHQAQRASGVLQQLAGPTPAALHIGVHACSLTGLSPSFCVLEGFGCVSYSVGSREGS